MDRLSDQRRPSEHDCDRILYSDELRRLGGVTQVVAVGEMPLFHTRLTHTLKVQQLARRLAEHIDRDPSLQPALRRIGGIDVGAAEAAGLAHDLGHPPFGHVGEQALNRMCHDAGLDGFEGNAQTFRILTRLASRGEEDPFGLGISDVTLRAVIKHPWMRNGDHESDTKWNAYPTEKGEFDRVRRGMLPEQKSIEAAVMDWADDVTYAIHDLEDFVRAGRVPIAGLATDRVEMATFTTRAIGRLSPKHPDVDWDAVAAEFKSLVGALFAQLGLQAGTLDRVAALRSACKFLINDYISATTIVDAEQPFTVPPLIRGEVELFKQLTWHYVIHDPGLATMQEGQAKLVEELFRRLVAWLDATEAEGEEFRLPVRLRELYSITSTEPESHAYHTKGARRARAVADYIASLTEGQVVNLHERLGGVGGHSALDRWLEY